MEVSKTPRTASPQPFHLAVLGGGSAAFAAAIKAHELGARVTIVNAGLPIGGTCVNVGCIPSKTLIRAAEVHHRAAHHGFAGIRSSSTVEDFAAIMAQKRQLVEALRQEKYVDVIRDLERVRYREGRGRLVDRKTVLLDGERLEADAVLIATGAAPSVPDILGLEEVGSLTSESAFELAQLPPSMLVMGGRYVALEIAQMFARLGTRVTILQRSSRILPTEAVDITNALTDMLTGEGLEVVTDVSVGSVRREGDDTVVSATTAGRPHTFRARHLLVATGRRANTRGLGLEALGVRLRHDGSLDVGDDLQTSVPGIYGAGDVLGERQFVYTAAYEGALAAENAVTGTQHPRNYDPLPWVIFTDPQVAGVGKDERQAAADGIDAEAVVLPLSHVPRALAARDTRGFIKLIRDRKTDRILGARILAPEGSELTMEVAMALRYGATAESLATMFHPYLTLSEGVKLAAISFGKNVARLSCCAT